MTTRRKPRSAGKSRLQLLEERYELLMGAINEGVYDWNVVDDTIHYSENVQRAVGLPARLLKTPADWRRRIHPEDLPRYTAGILEHFKRRTKRFECDYRYRALDDSWRWARQHGIALRDASGRAVRMIGATGDITELKRAEEALRRTEERMTLATSAATEGIYEWDLASSSLFLTDRAREVFSLAGEQLTPAAWNTRVHAEDFPGYRAALVAYFKGRTPHFEHEYRIADGRGGYKWVLDRGTGARGPDGRVGKLVGALTDITQRKRTEIDLREARDQARAALADQTATAEILRVMAASPSDIKPVFDAIAASATRLCDASFCVVFRFDGEVITVAADDGNSPGTVDVIRAAYPSRPGPHSIAGRVISGRRALSIADAQHQPNYPQAAERARAIGYRSILAVPMLKGDRAIGTINVARLEVRPFTEAQIELLKTFADQAVIAIENVRLFNETHEALEQQKASGEVLNAISGSISDTAPVFDKILDSCQRLFAGTIVGLNLVGEDGQLYIGAYHGKHREQFERIFPIPLTPNSGSGLAILEKRVVHYPDAQQGAEVPARTRQGCTAVGIKSVIFAPVQWESRGLGAIFVGRAQVSSFSDREIALLRTFADQAAIAIENARLFNETKEALEQQTATAEILKVTSGSLADVKPVFDAILAHASNLCEAGVAAVFLFDGEVLTNVAQRNASPEFARFMSGVRSLPSLDTTCRRCALECRTVHTPDLLSDPEFAPPEAHRRENIRTVLSVPMLREGSLVGVITLWRREVRPFTAKQIALVETFARQAVLAIESARLFGEIQEKSRLLEAASRHKSEFLANMSHELRTPLNAIIGFTRIVMRKEKERIEPLQYDNLEKILASGQHLLALINSILDLSKIEAGRVEVHAAPVGLAPVLEQCVRTVEPLVRADAVALVREFEGALPEMYVDEEKLRQIVINLLSNAAKFTERGTIQLRARASNGSVSVAVADTGIGIAADKLDLIFEEFEQADAGSTRIYGGTGLGLTIARRLARLMGGDIQAESLPGSGSTFTLTLPVRYAA